MCVPFRVPGNSKRSGFGDAVEVVGEIVANVRRDHDVPDARRRLRGPDDERAVDAGDARRTRTARGVPSSSQTTSLRRSSVTPRTAARTTPRRGPSSGTSGSASRRPARGPGRRSAGRASGGGWPSPRPDPHRGHVDVLVVDGAVEDRPDKLVMVLAGCRGELQGAEPPLDHLAGDRVDAVSVERRRSSPAFARTRRGCGASGRVPAPTSRRTP